MANDIRICKCCGKEYKYCPKCKKYANLPMWMWKCDTEECNELFDVISGYKMGIKTVNDVKDVVDIYSITDFSKYNEGIANTLKELFSEDEKKSSKKTKKKEMDIDFNKEGAIDEVAEELVVVAENNVTKDIEVEINTLIPDHSIDTNSNLSGISNLI